MDALPLVSMGEDVKDSADCALATSVENGAEGADFTIQRKPVALVNSEAVQPMAAPDASAMLLKSPGLVSRLSRAEVLQQESPQPSPRIIMRDSPGVSPGMRGEKRRRLFIDVSSCQPSVEEQKRPKDSAWWKSALARKPTSGHLGVHVHKEPLRFPPQGALKAGSSGLPSLASAGFGAQIISQGNTFSSTPFGPSIVSTNFDGRQTSRRDLSEELEKESVLQADSLNAQDKQRTPAINTRKRNRDQADEHIGELTGNLIAKRKLQLEDDKGVDASGSVTLPAFEQQAQPACVSLSRTQDVPCYDYGVCTSKNCRASNEDRFSVMSKVKGDADASFYGVFDGHGGVKVAEYCAATLFENIAAEPSYSSRPAKALVDGFLKTDADIGSGSSHSRDSEFQGTTAVVCLARGHRLMIANVGDSRAILVKLSGSAVSLSRDHKTNRQDEVDRIIAAGGGVEDGRVDGILAVTRALGDKAMKNYVTAEPEVVEHMVDKNEDRLVVLATDGLWDVVSVEEAGRIARTGDQKAQAIAARLVERAIELGSRDNTTALVIDLSRESRTH